MIMNMKTILLAASLLAMAGTAAADSKTVTSPDGKLSVDICTDNGALSYSITYDGMQVMQPSALGIKTDVGDFTKNLTLTGSKEEKIDKAYTMTRTKASSSHYVANKIAMTFTAKDGKHPMTLEMQVSNNDVAYRYFVDGSHDWWKDEPRRMTVLGEASSFRLPDGTTTFICPQIDGDNKGWMATKPSYEEEYEADAPMNKKSRFGYGYTFPCLFHVNGEAAKSVTNTTAKSAKANTKKSNKNADTVEDAWVLISETGTSSSYCGCHLSDFSTENGYTIAFPDKTENHGLGSTTPAMSLPGYTPWRTITVGKTLKPIVETTIPYDVVDPLYDPHKDMKPGRYTWSWIIWQDNSINYDDQVKFIDTAAKMGYEYCLVDGGWEHNIGRARIAELSKYAQSKGVHLLLWYNSNGNVNNAPQDARNCMNTSIAREREMAWMESIGVKGIKVDFFGGDKQQTIQLYEDLLSDANRHGIQCIFHGCTLPRGWERMYPNYVSSEAVLASENVYFSEHHAKQEGFELTMHPYCRNTVASMDWGGTMMNRFMSQDNKSRHQRYTTDVFEMAAGIVNQASIQCITIQPNNLTDLPQFELDFLKDIPSTWDETLYIDGYPTKSVIMARRHGNDWYVAGLNGTNETITKTISLPMFAAGQEVTLYGDNVKKDGETVASSYVSKAKVDKKGCLKITMQPMGGVIVKK